MYCIGKKAASREKCRVSASHLFRLHSKNWGSGKYEREKVQRTDILRHTLNKQFHQNLKSYKPEVYEITLELYRDNMDLEMESRKFSFKTSSEVQVHVRIQAQTGRIVETESWTLHNNTVLMFINMEGILMDGDVTYVAVRAQKKDKYRRKG